MSASVVPLRARQTRQWATGRLSQNDPAWNVYTRPADADLRHGLGLIRARSRELCQNSDHARGFLRIVRNNIVGAPGFVLQSRAQRANGKPDQQVREALESSWKEWGRRGNCEVSGRFSWRELQRHIVETVARDGEAFVRILAPWDSKWGMALQIIDPEAVDIDFVGEFEGREIRMGVELDAYRRPVAYWVREEPMLNRSSYRVGDRFRIPADEMLHIYRAELSWQTRGVPWLATSAGRLHMIQSTEDAEVTAARASAAKFAGYEAQEWAPPPEPAGNNLVDVNGNPLTTDPGAFSQDVAPGSMEVVPWGYKLNMYDPQHPNAAMPDFLKWGLRSVATGGGVSYNTLGNDAEGVNYTSLRFFLGVERDNWMEAQDWFEAELPEPVRAVWTDTQIAMGTVQYRPNRAAELHRVKWQPRRWEGPDPAKQSKADETELSIGTTTLTEIAARKGRDLDDMIGERVREIARIKAAAEAAGLTLADVLPAMSVAKPENPMEPDDDDD